VLISQLLPRVLVASEHSLSARVEDLLVGDELSIDRGINDLVSLQWRKMRRGQRRRRKRREEWKGGETHLASISSSILPLEKDHVSKGTDESQSDVGQDESVSHNVARLVLGSVDVARDGSVEVSKADDHT